jgi:hypothetical protein
MCYFLIIYALGSILICELSPAPVISLYLDVRIIKGGIFRENDMERETKVQSV